MQQVLDKLIQADFDTVRAYPAQTLPALDAVRVTVSLNSTDHKAGTAEILACVCAPLSLGGSVCEDAAQQVCELLRDMGGQCGQSQCARIARTDILCVEVSAVFPGWYVGGGWTGITASLGGAALEGVRAVKVWRSIGDAESLSGAVWKFRIEQELLPGASEGAAITEPFTLTVIRGARTETYGECSLTYHRCEMSNGSFRRILQGVAASRTVKG